MLTTGNALALRVSLVYGWHRVGLRPNFFTLCAQRLSAGQPVAVPNDHWNSPILVNDVAAWTTALLDSEHTGVVHLGGPQRLTKVAWARHIAEAYRVDPDLVRPTPRHSTAYACRPRNACLHSERARDFPELKGLHPVDVLEASWRARRVLDRQRRHRRRPSGRRGPPRWPGAESALRPGHRWKGCCPLPRSGFSPAGGRATSWIA